MQYLLKIELDGTEMWRLISVDGEADTAHVAELIARAFEYDRDARSFEIGGRIRSAGTGGDIDDFAELKAFDTLGLGEGDVAAYFPDRDRRLRHTVRVMKAAGHLDCFLPACLIGQGSAPGERPVTVELVNARLADDATPSLDLRAVTARLRALGARRGRSSLNASLSVGLNIELTR